MKLFCCSDLHSYYTATKKALDEAGFDKDNPEHWLIVCGDCFDRGGESEEVLHFLMSLERKALVKGNHDLLLEECCKREFPYKHDFSNGTKRTVSDLGDEGMGYPFDICCQRTLNKTAAYRDLLVNYFETENYIFVHSWIPTKISYAGPRWYEAGKTYSYKEDWRDAIETEWEEAMWGNPFELAEQGLNQTGKTIVFGHWHCSRGWTKVEGRSEFGEDARWDPYINEEQNIIGLDTCTAYTGKVNVLVLEDNFI